MEERRGKVSKSDWAAYCEGFEDGCTHARNCESLASSLPPLAGMDYLEKKIAEAHSDTRKMFDPNMDNLAKSRKHPSDPRFDEFEHLTAQDLKLMADMAIKV